MNDQEEFFIRELTRKLDEQINSVRRELDNLKQMGLLKTKSKNRKKYYCINKDFPILNELKTIFVKALSRDKSFASDIAKLGDVKVLVLSGQFVNKETDSVDMLIVGAVNKDALADYLNNEINTQRPVKFSILDEQDYVYRLSLKDKFIADLLNDEDNQVLIKKI